MQIVTDMTALDPCTVWWVPAVAAPERDWPGAPDCRRGARFLIDAGTFRPGHNHFPAFETRAECLRWIMAHRTEIAQHAPAVHINAVPLAQWMLGVGAV